MELEKDFVFKTEVQPAARELYHILEALLEPGEKLALGAWTARMNEEDTIILTSQEGQCVLQTPPWFIKPGESRCVLMCQDGHYFAGPAGHGWDSLLAEIRAEIGSRNALAGQMWHEGDSPVLPAIEQLGGMELEIAKMDRYDEINDR